MKTLNTVLKVVAALAAVAGVIYVIAAYGDRIVAWAKNLIASLPKCPNCVDADIIIDDESDFADTAAPAEDFAPMAEEPAAEAPEQEPVVEEIPLEEPVPAPLPNEPVAEETDFAE